MECHVAWCGCGKWQEENTTFRFVILQNVSVTHIDAYGNGKIGNRVRERERESERERKREREKIFIFVNFHNFFFLGGGLGFFF